MADELMESLEEQPEITEDQLLDSFADGFDEEEVEQPEVEENEETEIEAEEEQPEEAPARTYNVGGKEFTEEEVLSWQSKASDYRQKTQQLAEERKIVQPFSAMNSFLQQNPDKLKQVVDLLKEKPVEEQAPEDPLEALKWEAKQEALAAFREESKPLAEQQQAFQQQMQIQQTMQQVQADPLYQETHGKLDAYVKQDYAKIHGVEQAKALYARLDSDPALYKQMYAKFRAEPEKKPLGNKQRKAPIVESGGHLPPTPQAAKKVTRGKELNKLASKVYSEGTSEALGDYLDKSDFLAEFLA